MLDEKIARMRAHRNNIHRYRRLLNTKLSEIERQFVQRRLDEEESAIATMANSIPIHLVPRKPTNLPCWEGRP